jgi:hypothetical protein
MGEEKLKRRKGLNDILEKKKDEGVGKIEKGKKD